MRIAADITARWSVCWATTYTFEPAFFESFLLKRLGDPPINSVVVADFIKLTQLWQTLDPRESRLRTTNRRYLLRGAEIRGGAFHPKTLLLANKNTGVLFVGSGNLGLGGVEQGREVFTRFDSRTPADLPAFKSWRAWMSDVVTLVDDAALRARFADLMARASWLAGATAASGLVTNWRSPLVDQLFADNTRWTELHVTAPFFDSDLRALKELLKRAAPKRFVMYVGKDASVDGRRLVELVRQAAPKTATYTFEPSTYVHAKIVAIVRGQRARVLSGSPNLSGPALLGTVMAGNANAEVGVITEMSSEDAVGLFTPPSLEIVPIAESSLRKLRMESEPTTTMAEVHLMSAVQGSDGFVTVGADQVPAHALLTDGTSTVPLRATRTAGPFPVAEGAVLVWLTRADSSVVSNRVPLDDQVALARSLQESRPSDDRPPDLDALDVQHPMGRLLAELHQTALFEIDTSPAARRVASLVEESSEDTSEFWDRYLKEQLAQDPRASRYWRSRGAAEPLSDELSRLLEQMLHQVSGPGRLRLLSGEEVTKLDLEKEGRKWTPSQRLAVRAYNVLRRWCLAVADPRIRWLSEQAPVRHYVALLGAIVRIWQQRDWLPEHRLGALAGTLFGAFIRTERTSGYLEALSELERNELLVELRKGAAPQHAAAVAFAALHRAGPDEFFEWQPFLARGITWGIFLPGDEVGALVASMVDVRPTADEVRNRLTFVAKYTDDEHWARRQRAELGFKEITLDDLENPNYPLQVTVEVGVDLLTDPRVVALAREALIYEGAPGVRIRTGADLLAVALQKPVYGFVGGVEVESRDPVSDSTLDQMTSDGVAFGAIVGKYAQTA